MDKIAQIGDEVRFSQSWVENGVGIVCAVYDGYIEVGFKERYSFGWMWDGGEGGCKEAQKRGLKYGWWVSKDNYTITRRYNMWKYNDILVNENKYCRILGVCDEWVGVTRSCNSVEEAKKCFTSSDFPFTQKELEEKGWELYTEPTEEMVTLKMSRKSAEQAGVNGFIVE